MLTDVQVHNEIEKCKFNIGSKRRELYPDYMSEYMIYIDEDQRCADLDYIHNVYGKTDKPIIEGMYDDCLDNSDNLPDFIKMILFILSVVVIVLMFVPICAAAICKYS